MKFRRAVFSFTGLFYATSDLWACATCGLTQSFNSSTLLVSLLFLLLPLSLVLALGVRVWRDAKHGKSRTEIRRENRAREGMPHV